MTGLAAALLAAGALRGELASLAWGSAFLLLALYSLAGSHLYALLLRRHLRRRPEPLDLTLPVPGVFAGQEAEARVRAEMPRVAVPGFAVELLLPLHFQGRPPLLLRCPLPRGGSSRVVRLPCPHRGSYAGSRARLVVADRLGFTRNACGLPLQETLRVYPALTGAAAPQPPSRQGGQRLQRRRRRPSEELLEVRRYFPGDDPRRLHWKVFAHTRELFLRMGEDSPPPSTRRLVLLDVCPSPFVPAELAADHLDGLVEACTAALRGAPPGTEVLFAASCDGDAQPVSRETFPELLSRLAGLGWDDRLAFGPSGRRGARDVPEAQVAPAGRGTPPMHDAQVLLYSTPGSSNLPSLVRSLLERGCAVRLLFKGLPEPPRPEIPSRARGRRLLLREPGAPRAGAHRPAVGRSAARWSAARRSAVGRSAAAARGAFDEALEAAVAHWRRRLGGKGHAQRI